MKFLVNILILLLATSAFAGQCPSSIYYSNGNYFKSGSSLYYPNGNYMKSGSSLYHSNGNYLKSGSSFYYSNGNYAKSGSTLYDENGNTVSGTSISIDLNSIGTARVSKTGITYLKVDEIEHLIEIAKDGTMSCSGGTIPPEKPTGDVCPNSIYYSNGSYLKSGSSLYYPDGSYLKSGSSLYHDSGSYLKSGSSYYYANGSYAKSGSSLYRPNGDYVASTSSTVSVPLGNIGSAIVSRSGWSVLSIDGATTEFVVLQDGSLLCR